MDPNKAKALDAAMSQIERQFGKGTVMRMGDQERVALPVYIHRLTGARYRPRYRWPAQRAYRRNIRS